MACVQRSWSQVRKPCIGFRNNLPMVHHPRNTQVGHAERKRREPARVTIGNSLEKGLQGEYVDPCRTAARSHLKQKKLNSHTTRS